MKATRIAAILGLSMLVACGLYTGDGTERHGGPTVIDAGHGSSCGGSPDAGVVGDGGAWLPDGGWSNDGGGWGLPDAGWTQDGGGYLPDAFVGTADAGHH